MTHAFVLFTREASILPQDPQCIHSVHSRSMAEQEAHAEQAYDEQDEEVYEDEIPVGDGMGEGDDAGQPPVDPAELEAMKKKLSEMEEEAARLRALQAGGQAGAAAGAGSAETAAAAAEAAANKEEADSRSIYVGNVDYSCTPEELQQHFQSCGTVNRVTILTDKFGSPKGYAYVEFLEVDAVSNAILLDNTELRGRNIKVVQKRTNVPGLKARGRGRGRGGGRFGGGWGGYPGFGYFPMPFMAPAFPGARGARGRGRGRGGGRFFAPY